MGTLKGLPGIAAEEIACEFFEKPTEIKKILDAGLAATQAGNNGAINIWKDDYGFIRCESMRWCKSIDKQKFYKISDVKEWAKKWLKEIQ